MSDSLSGRTALITGASGGIGGALALKLAEDGVDLVLGYSSHRADAERVARAAFALGRKAVVVQADLADPEAPAALVERAEAELGKVDILIPNAGVGRQMTWDEVDLDGWDTTLAVNTRAPFLMAQRALPGMIERRWGRVLFVSSIAGFTGGVVGPHYAASKAALHGLTHHLASRVASDGVTVNAIAPALIEDTRMLPKGAGAPNLPVGRRGRPEEVASMAYTMLLNGYLTSKVITLDGGIYPY
jgi:3-oxoacyl-[acyl-carrier protein] reductase